MAIDLCITLACTPKAQLGNGDADAGMQVILEMLKARMRADTIEEQCRRDGTNPETAQIQVVTRTPDGERTESVTVPGLRARALPLDSLAGHCQSCPARACDYPFGCFAAVNYPIPRAAEEWMMAALRPASELGGIVCLQALSDFGWDGTPVRAMRAAGLFESREPIMRDLGGSWLSSDAILQAFLCLGTLQPTHCAIGLSWFGASVDGQWLVGSDKTDIRPLLAIPPHERASRARFGMPPPPNGAHHLALLFYMAERAWMNDRPLAISA